MEKNKKSRRIEVADLSTYSSTDVRNAVNYANHSIMLEPEEIGKNVYDTLHEEKLFEYLNHS